MCLRKFITPLILQVLFFSHALSFPCIRHAPGKSCCRRLHRKSYSHGSVKLNRNSNNLISRRRVVLNGPLSYFGFQMLQPKVVRAATLSSVRRKFKNLNDALAFIKTNCKAYIKYVIDSGGYFLYRGEQLPEKSIAFIRRAKPDLLNLETYNSSAAAQYFREMDKLLSEEYNAEARPSTSIIAVGNKKAAALWGEPCSIWPISDKLNWTWLEHSFEFWDAGWETSAGGSIQNGNRGPYFWNGNGALKEYLDAGIVVDRLLPEAIRSEHEIFLTWSASDSKKYESKCESCSNVYVAVPAQLDDEVRKILGIELKLRLNPRFIFDINSNPTTWELHPGGGTAAVAQNRRK